MPGRLPHRLREAAPGKRFKQAMKFYEREEALQQLKEIQAAAAKTAQMTFVTGRHRIGKTQLVLRATEGTPTLYFFIARKAESLLCHEFAVEVERVLGLPDMSEVNDFRTLFKALMATSKERTFNVVIDEFQEFNTINANIFTDLQSLWDRNKDRSHLCLFLLGNSNAQTTRIFEGNHAPLAGRVTNVIRLRPFTTQTLKEILAEARPDYTPEDLLAFYTFTGGVPKYTAGLVAAGALNAEAILDLVCRQDSPYLSEGKQLLIEDFGKEYTIYFSILTCIANGITSRSYIEEYIQKEIGGYLTRLETDFHLIRKLTPLFSKSGAKNVRYTIVDNFLRFWFRFIYSHADLVERGRYDELRAAIATDFPAYSSQCLHNWFWQRFAESGEFSLIGGWWDHRGENDIDLIGLVETEKRAVVAGIAQQSGDIDPHALAQKVGGLNGALESYQVTYRAYGLDNL